MAAIKYRPIPELSGSDISRFWKYVDKTPGLGPTGECWKWIGLCDHAGYGLFTKNQRNFRAHRISFFIDTGTDPGQKEVCHGCDWPFCVRHLFMGTRSENQLDMKQKGRAASGDRNGSRLHPELILRGERHPMAKITWDIVKQIRSYAAEHERSGVVLARKFSLSTSMVKNIIRGVNWKPD